MMARKSESTVHLYWRAVKKKKIKLMMMIPHRKKEVFLQTSEDFHFISLDPKTKHKTYRISFMN